MNFQEYNSESIDWTMVDFEDNQECLDLIEKVSEPLKSLQKMVFQYQFSILVHNILHHRLVLTD